MKEQIIKPVVKMGNSACVMLPKKWVNGKARVELIQEPVDITKDVMEILKPYLKNIFGIYLIGSHVRNEQTEQSDIDILAITEGQNKKIILGKYEIILISKEVLEKALKRNIIPLLPMIKEAKAIMNEGFLKEYENVKLNKRNTKWIREATVSSQKVNRQAIKLSRELNENVSDGIMYSIILGLRSAYIINCLRENKIPTKKELKNLVVNLVNTEEPYKAYLRSKNNERDEESVSPEVAEKLNDSIKIRYE